MTLFQPYLFALGFMPVIKALKGRIHWWWYRKSSGKLLYWKIKIFVNVKISCRSLNMDDGMCAPILRMIDCWFLTVSEYVYLESRSKSVKKVSNLWFSVQTSMTSISTYLEWNLWLLFKTCWLLWVKSVWSWLLSLQREKSWNMVYLDANIWCSPDIKRIFANVLLLWFIFTVPSDDHGGLVKIKKKLKCSQWRHFLLFLKENYRGSPYYEQKTFPETLKSEAWKLQGLSSAEFPKKCRENHV